eukprot:CAMPEP_0194336810 /NCGR_PEP_ID=MMETSP0171-20130528/74264_1 /TAXON_ID=218684 /ORGANISM="Corethron pennatum, Strain L29A3" /LENGTH=183 /DNA_ID=CAMNT_0039100385 /DNA_START=66 /DNA_END=617 /DNA_ORIENTATION=+
MAQRRARYRQFVTSAAANNQNGPEIYDEGPSLPTANVDKIDLLLCEDLSEDEYQSEEFNNNVSEHSSRSNFPDDASHDTASQMSSYRMDERDSLRQSRIESVSQSVSQVMEDGLVLTAVKQWVELAGSVEDVIEDAPAMAKAHGEGIVQMCLGACTALDFCVSIPRKSGTISETKKNEIMPEI